MKSKISQSVVSLFCIFLIFTQTIDAISENGLKKREENTVSAKRVLQGSAPPSCVGKCGGCRPCERVSVEVSPGDYVWRCACTKKRLLQGSVAPSCRGRCPGCRSTCERVKEEVAPGEYEWKCVCRA